MHTQLYASHSFAAVIEHRHARMIMASVTALPLRIFASDCHYSITCDYMLKILDNLKHIIVSETASAIHRLILAFVSFASMWGAGGCR